MLSFECKPASDLLFDTRATEQTSFLFRSATMKLLWCCVCRSWLRDGSHLNLGLHLLQHDNRLHVLRESLSNSISIFTCHMDKQLIDVSNYYRHKKNNIV